MPSLSTRPSPSSPSTPRRWVLAPEDPRVRAWSESLGVGPVTAQIMANRLGPTAGLDVARTFLSPRWDHLHDPATLPDIAAAAQSLAQAITHNRRIVIYGDYDVDGVTGTAVMWHALRLAGADVDYYIPHRVDEGYGLHAAAIRELAAAGAKVILTVDCGTTAHEAATAAAQAGVELVITDHHKPDAGPLPTAVAVVNPNRADSGYPDPHLCGAGVAFNVAWELFRKLSGGGRVSPAMREALLSATGLVALATVADVVPLSTQNRILAAKGLAALPHSTNPGIAALLASAKLDKAVDAWHVGYQLGPRINAIGRLGHARLAVEMFTTAHAGRAAEIAAYLHEQNLQRRKQEKALLQQAMDRIAAGEIDLDADRSIVLADARWHPGLVGIVAGRLAETYQRPTVLLWVQGDTAGGSARGIAGFDVHAALMACQAHTLRCGGHAAAGGLKLAANSVGAFAKAFDDYCRTRITPADMTPRLAIDAKVHLPQLSESAVAELERLGPFGHGNPRPLLMACGVTVAGPPRLIKDAHLSFQLSQAGRGLRGVYWQRADLLRSLADGDRIDVVFEPKINEYQNRRSVELEIRDLRPHAANPASHPI